MECSIDERDQDPDKPPMKLVETMVEGYESLARALIDARENIPLGFYELATRNEWMHRLSFLAFACEHPSRRKRAPVDIEDMIGKWLPLIRQLAMAHDIDERDKASSQLDEYLTPIIAAPVVQIRTFYRELVKRMKADASIPWAVWKMFEFWGTNVLDKIEKEEVIGLKNELAKRIAENSFAQIPSEDWILSMVGALQWREPEKLKQIEASLEAGHKPRVRGKQSCLFLQVGETGLEVML
jgi:hypothetical protein